MHGVVEHAQLAAERLHNALQSQADAEHRHAQPHRRLHQFGHAEIGGAAGTGRDQDQARRQLRDQLRRKAGAIGHHFGAGLARVVGQRVDEAIVVIHQQQFRAGARGFALHRSGCRRGCGSRPACGRSRWP